MPTFGSLFAGIGGLDLGLERAGWECKWQVEIDDYCRRVLTKHWPDVRKWLDVRTFPRGAAIRWGPLPPLDNPYGYLKVDLIAGGFPCQPVSVAGKRRGQDDERWLWPEFERVIRVLRPRFVLVENVPGLLVRGMGDVLGGLARCGYDAEWDCIPAAAVGAPHLRYRVFIVAYAESVRREWTGPSRDGRTGLTDGGTDVDDTDRRRYGTPNESVFAGGFGTQFASWWATEPDVGRVAHGVLSRVHRLRGLGNAVVPQVAEWIGRRLMESA